MSDERNAAYWKARYIDMRKAMGAAIELLDVPPVVEATGETSGPTITDVGALAPDFVADPIKYHVMGGHPVRASEPGEPDGWVYTRDDGRLGATFDARIAKKKPSAVAFFWE